MTAGGTDPGTGTVFQVVSVALPKHNDWPDSTGGWILVELLKNDEI
jgi:hypothetical protein